MVGCKKTEEYFLMEELCNDADICLNEVSKKMINYLKERYSTYGELIQRLDQFEREIKWNGPRAMNALTLLVVKQARNLVATEMNNLEIKLVTKKVCYKDLFDSQEFVDKVKTIVGKNLGY